MRLNRFKSESVAISRQLHRLVKIPLGAIGCRCRRPISPTIGSLFLSGLAYQLSTLADNPLARIGVQRFAAIFLYHQCLAELQAHFFVVGHEIGLDDDHHVFVKDHFTGIMPLARFGLKDRRILIDAVDQIVVGAIAALVDDFRGLFGFGRRRAVFDHLG